MMKASLNALIGTPQMELHAATTVQLDLLSTIRCYINATLAILWRRSEFYIKL